MQGKGKVENIPLLGIRKNFYPHTYTLKKTKQKPKQEIKPDATH